MSESLVPLKRQFSPITDTPTVDEQAELARLWARPTTKSWSELESEFRVIILADAGSGKTVETLTRAKGLSDQGHNSFCIRIEDIDEDFEEAFEVGTPEQFEKWLGSSEDGWLFLDSVDEARLVHPKTFEKAIKRVARRISRALQRTHIYITSRPYAWRFGSDRALIEQHLPYAHKRNEPKYSNDKGATKNEKPESSLNIYGLRPLTTDDIRLFAEHRSAPNIDDLLAEIERANLVSLAERPFDLDSLLDKWKNEQKLGSRLEAIQYNIKTRLKEIDPDRESLQPLNLKQADKGARLLAAAVTLTDESGILIPDHKSYEQRGIDAQDALVGWSTNPKDITALLERGIFNDILFGTVRFRHGEIRELLTAQWFASLLEKDHSRRYVESLIFREQYGEQFIAPRLRPVLPWLILFDEKICERALALQPQIAVEGGDIAQLSYDKRKRILHDIVERIAADTDGRSARDNSAIARIAQSDLTVDVQQLIATHRYNDDAIFFLGRLVWQGNMSACVEGFCPIAKDPERNIYSRIASVRAVVTAGSYKQRIQLWTELNELPEKMPRRLLVEFIENASSGDGEIQCLLTSIDKLQSYDRFESTGLNQSLHAYIKRISSETDSHSRSALLKLITGFHRYLEREPYKHRQDCKVSKEFTWLMGPASHGIELLINVRAEESFNDAVISTLLKVPAIRNWTEHDLKEHKSKLQELIPQWSALNDTLFWKSIEQARPSCEAEGKPLTYFHSISWMGHYWKYTLNDFPRALEFIHQRKLEDDQLMVLSLCVRLFRDAGSPEELEVYLRKAVSGSLKLQERLYTLLNPPISEKNKRWEQEEADLQKKQTDRQERKEKERRLWIQDLKNDPERVRSPKISPGEISGDHCHLYREMVGENSQSHRGKGADWRALASTFGSEVACAFRDALMSHWRAFNPGTGSEGADMQSIPYALVLAMAGLEIEANEIQDFPSHLTQEEANHALNYITRELNGFPDWLEAFYKIYPCLITDFVWRELRWELENTPDNSSKHYILHDLVHYSPWLHAPLSSDLLVWLRTHSILNKNGLMHCLRILNNDSVTSGDLSDLAKYKIAQKGTADQLAIWYALWVDTEPTTGVPAVKSWLDNLQSAAATEQAQLFITTLVGSRAPNEQGLHFQNYRTAIFLKKLYVLMHQYIKSEDDIDRSNQGVFSPELRDGAQDARNRLYNFLFEISDKDSYFTIKDLADTHPDPGYRDWMSKQAYQIAEQHADLEVWTIEQVRDFSANFEKTPASHRQLFELGVLRLSNFKDWLELGDDSLYETYQRAEDEDEIRKIVSHWLSSHARGLYTCSQENPLANDQRPDIWLQNPQVSSAVPIEIKLLDKGWTGPALCNGLRNQLAGDYLREVSSRCGVFLLVWQGKNPGKQWVINEKRVDISGLETALTDYWNNESGNFPNVSAVKVILIDLTVRRHKSCR